MNRINDFTLRTLRWATRNWKHAIEKRALGRWKQLEQHLPRTSDGRLLLHIGCGDVNAKNFVNIDARPLPHVHIVADSLFNLYMIPDGVADMVYMCHVLEHVSHTELQSTLLELRRVLKRSGVLRLSVPDFDKLLDIYLAEGGDLRVIEQPLMGGQNYPQNFHYSVFNEKLLRLALQHVGMLDIQLWDANECKDHDFVDWANQKHGYNGKKYDVSLNIEARAP